MRPDKRCASHVSLSPRVTAPVAKTRCARGGRRGARHVRAALCGWMSCRRLAALSRSLGCLGSVICGVCTTNAGHVSPLKFVASRLCLLATLLRILSSFFAPLLATTFLHFLQVFFCCFCPETQMDIAICVIRAVPPASSHLNPLCVPPKEQAGACFSARCFSLHSFLCFCHVLSTIVANTRLDPNLTRSNNLESFLISRHHQRGTANREQGTEGTGNSKQKQQQSRVYLRENSRPVKRVSAVAADSIRRCRLTDLPGREWF